MRPQGPGAEGGMGMDPMFHDVAVFIKPTETKTADLEALIALVESEGFKVWVCERSAALLKGRSTERPGYSRRRLGELCDIALVLGGDGTMLGVTRDLSEFDIPIVGINAGRLGFITDMVVGTMHELLPPILKGRFIKDRRYLLEGEVIRNGDCLFKHIAVNDIGLSNGRVGGIIEARIDVNGDPMACQLADGIICASTTGSTAYSLAAGGPLLHPALDGICLVPVAAHTLSNRPIVLPGDAVIEVTLLDAREAVAYFDVQEFFDVQPGDVLRVKRSERTLTMLHPEGYDFFELLRRKLKWNYMPANHAKNESSM